MSRGAYRSSFAARRPAKSAHEVRGLWVTALDLADRLATTAASDTPSDDAALGFGVGMTRLMVMLRDLEPGNFPLPGSSAQAFAGAFLTLARTFVNPACNPQARTACAPFLKAGVACLDRLLTELRTEEGRFTRQILGERDED